MILLDVLASNPKLEGFINSLIEQGSHLGWTIIKAIIVFVVGRFIIRMINKLVRRILTKRDFDPSVKTFVGSLVNVTLMILLIISVVGALGVQTTSFAALLASAGVAIGMALSGNLSNFAGGLIILLFKPYKVGDYIESQGVGGTVREIQIFHTILLTADNKNIFIPSALADSSVNVVVRVWVKSSDYWGVYFDTNKAIYATFNAEGIGFPFPQLTVHQAKD